MARDGTAGRGLSYAVIRELLREHPLPAAFVDLDAFDRNLARVVSQVAPRHTPLRVASKSVRVVALLRRLLDRGGAALHGLMCFAVPEAAFLAAEGFDDLLVAYPPMQRADVDLAARLVAEGVTLSLVADSVEGLARVAAAARGRSVEIPVVLCADMSLRLARGKMHVGVRRSPLHDVAEVVQMAERVAATPGIRFRGLMAYEAQVAGLGDDNPFEPALNPIKSWLRKASTAEIARRRNAMVEALHAVGLPPTLVNGGGSGSLDSTTPASGVTEVTAGSAFFKPHLFDYYKSAHMRQLEPACFFALEATRRPAPDMVTCLGGGYVASGSVGRDKVPLPWLPRGLSLLPAEMCGEVQTPLRLRDPAAVRIGDPVVFRHAKAGELAERFDHYLLVSAGKVVDRVPTYRGQGQCFF